MPKNSPPLGSVPWKEQVFTSPPARRLKGHSRHTRHHLFQSNRLNALIGVEGRNEYCAVLAIEYLVAIGIIRRAKPQPFVTEIGEFGHAIFPDFLVEGADEKRSQFVIEAKSARFLTRAKTIELDEYKEKFAEFNINYLVWTDKRPLSHPVRHHLINMRASAQRVPAHEIERLSAWIATLKAPTLRHLYESGFDIDCLYAAAWEGKAFFQLTKPLSASSLLSLHPLENYRAIFLDCDNSMDAWWNALTQV